MASELFVDKITGKTGTSGGAPITLSGDTATLSGTGVTFPAGMVLNFVQNTDTGSTSGTSSYFVTYCHCDITVKAGTKIYILGTPQLYFDTSGALIEVKLTYKTSSGRSGTAGDYTDILTYPRFFGGSASSLEMWTTYPVQYLWTHGQSAGTVINVAIQAKASSGSLANNNGTDAISIMTLQEIAV